MMNETIAKPAYRVLTLSTLGFTLMFAVWLMFGVLGIPIREEFDLSESQFGWLTAIAILNGSLWRLVFGLLADRYGGRKIFVLLTLATAIPAYLVSISESYTALMFCAFFVGMAGNSFSVGIAWCSLWFPRSRQGLALGVFGAGNVGASVTKLIGPSLIALVPATGLFGGLVPGGWRFVPFLYSILLILMAGAIWMLTPAHNADDRPFRSIGTLLRPLREMRVWRFSLYYVVMFGAYVALSLWLPRYYVDVFDLPLGIAALLTALFIFPASLLRPVGGWVSDRFGARRVMYWVFGVMSFCLLLLAAPNGHIVLYISTDANPQASLDVMHFVMNPWVFTVLVFTVGCGMGIGKAAIYKYIPEYFPENVGAVGGLVGMLGGLGGFFLPPMFSFFWQITHIPQTTFFILFLITAGSFLWLHLVVLGIHRKANPELTHQFEVKTSEAK